MPTGCEAHRLSLLLLALKRKLSDEELDDTQRKRMEEEAKALENALSMD